MPRLSLIACCLLVACANGPPPEPDPDTTYAIPAIGHKNGPDDALVTVVICSDFQCSACAKAAPLFAELLKVFEGDVRLLFVPFPLHDRSRPPAIAAECAANQDLFWPMHDELFDNQHELDERHLRSHAGRAGLVLGDWLECLEDPEVARRIDDRKQRMVDVGVIGTPSAFINGRYQRGLPSWLDLEALVTERLDEAEEAVAAGTPPADYYQREVIERGMVP